MGSLIKIRKRQSKSCSTGCRCIRFYKSKIFGESCPERFFNVGIAESNMVSMAAGLSTTGKIPFVNTFAIFISTLGLLSARGLISYTNLNVKLAGAYGGLSDAFDGPSHHSIEDIAIMRTLPNFKVLCASDEIITDWMVKTAIDVEGPMYIRLSRDSTPITYSQDTKFEIGKGNILKEGNDATIIACGIMVSKALEAAERLADKGHKSAVIDMFTIKPIDKDLILESVAKTGAIVTAEEHSVIGGSAVQWQKC